MSLPGYRTSHTSFGNVEKFKYLGTTVTDRNYVHEWVQSRLNSADACYRSVKNRPSRCDIEKMKVHVNYTNYDCNSFT
jgi:hypothetical protein